MIALTAETLRRETLKRHPDPFVTDGLIDSITELAATLGETWITPAPEPKPTGAHGHDPDKAQRPDGPTPTGTGHTDTENRT